MKAAKSLAALGLLLAATLAPGRPAHATTMFPQKFTCPIGGEAFEDHVIGSYSSWGQRPDGRSYGTLPVFPIVECPGNGFLLFDREFTEEEIALLEPLVTGAEYQAMRASETQNYRVWWMMEKIGRDPLQRVSALLRASWETDPDPARKARYQAAFAAAAMALSMTEANAEPWFWYNVRAANALRELGRFAEAEAQLARVEAATWPDDPDERDGAEYLIGGLRALIADRNPVAEPANLSPAEMAVARCTEETAALSPAERSACESDAVREAIARRAERNERDG